MAQRDQAVREFAASINDEIRSDAVSGGEYNTEAEYFADMVLEKFEDAGVVSDSVVCVREGKVGHANWAIAGWAFPPSEDEDLSELAILAILFHDDPGTPLVVAKDLRRQFTSAVNFIKGMLEGHANSLEPAADVAALGRLIHDRGKVLRKVTVHLATDGLTKSLKEIQSETFGKIEISCAIWDVERLSRLSDVTQEEIDIQIADVLEGNGLPCLQVPEDDEDYDAYLCVVPGVLLYHAYETYGQRLLESNVRAFLSQRGKVNKGIKETIENQPDRFFAFNNGLALTARRVEVRKAENGGHEITRIVGLQVVNGGQTTASIHRAYKLFPNLRPQIERVFVQAKLTVITTEEGDSERFMEMVRSISLYANRQNAVMADDLEANQPWHVRLEKLSRVTWTPDAISGWYYERSRGSYTTEKQKALTPAQKKHFERRWPRTQLITKKDLAKYWNAWDQKPEVVSLGGQKNFTQFMKSLDHQAAKPTLDESEFRRIVGKAILFRDATAAVNGQRHQIESYRANVIAYLVSYLSYRLGGQLDFLKIWDRQTVPPPIAAALQEWALPIYQQIRSSAGTRNVSEWAKKPGCWEAVRALDLASIPGLNLLNGAPPIGKRTSGPTASDSEAVSTCRRISLPDWEQLVHWVTFEANGHVDAVLPIVRLRNLALAGWATAPDSEDVWVGHRIITEWRQQSGEDAEVEILADGLMVGAHEREGQEDNPW